MKTAYKILLLNVLIQLMGCVTIQSNIKTDAAPTAFHRVLIVTKLRNAPATYVQQFARSFPAGYEVCTLALSPLSFDSPEEAIQKQVEVCQSEVILTLELSRTGHSSRYASYPYEYNAEMQSTKTGQPFWKAIISANPSYGEEVPPRSVIKRLLDDHIIYGKMPPSGRSYATN